MLSYWLMDSLLISIVIAVITVVMGFIINQLPPVQNVPGKNGYFFWLLVEIVALIVILGALGNGDMVSKLPWLKTGAYVAGAFLLYHTAQFGLAVWKHQRQLTETADAETGADNRRSDLVRVVLNEVKGRQRENLKNLEPQRIIPLDMQDVPEQVGRPALIPPQPAPSQTASSTLIERMAVPVRRWLKIGDRDPEEIAKTRQLIDVFRQVGGRLLVLGKPGAGKTTLLLELAEQLLEQAQQPEDSTVPVLLECSAWKDDGQPIEKWIVLQLKDKYNVPFGVSKQWIAQKQLVPLLDGLDELGLARQRTMIAAIDEFIRKHQYPSLVVCCRKEEFEQGQVQPVCLQGAVYLEPLTNDQIKNYLEEINRPQLWESLQSAELQALLPDWAEVEQDSGLPGLRSPLLLNMLLVAYQGQQIRSQSELFEAYIQERFRQYKFKHGKLPYSEAKTRHYLRWLARQLKARKVTEFEIENLQPYWLEQRWQRWVYRTVDELIGGLVGGLVGALFFGLVGRIMDGLVYGLVYGLVGVLFFALFFRLFFSLVDRLNDDDIFNLSPTGLQQGLSSGLNAGLGVGLSIGLNLGVDFGLGFGLVYGLFFGLVYGLVGGLVGGLFLGLIYGQRNGNIRTRSLPNQGIWDSVKNALILIPITGPAGVFLFTLSVLLTGHSVDWALWPLYSLALGLLFGVFVGIASIQHGALRVLLWISGGVPWNYAKFLDYVSEMRLMQRVGGRYRFLHDLLREHISKGAY